MTKIDGVKIVSLKNQVDQNMTYDRKALNDASDKLLDIADKELPLSNSFNPGVFNISFLPSFITRFSQNLRPISVSSIGYAPNSHPLGFDSTRPPKLLAISWCPKQIPKIGFL